MTQNERRAELEKFLYGILSPENANIAAGAITQRYDVTPKEDPEGTIRAVLDPEGEDSAVYVKTAPGLNGWAAVYFGTGYKHPVVYPSARYAPISAPKYVPETGS